MITETILFVFALLYWLFCVFLAITYVQEEKKYTYWSAIYTAVVSMILAPVAVPILLGIIIGEAIKETKG